MILVVAWDGADLGLVEPWIAAGELPHLAALVERGATRSLASTRPAVTFPAWTSFLTASSPDRHGIPERRRAAALEKALGLTYQQVRRRLTQDLGRDPLAEELAAEMNLEVDKIHHIQQISQDTVSLEAPVGEDDEDSMLGDFIEDEKMLSPDQEAALRLLKDHIRDILIDLMPREQKILRMRFGLDDGITHTLEEVGKVFGVTRERIRQIEAKAHEKIRQHDKIDRLRGY